MTTKSTEKAEAKQVVEPKEASKTSATKVATENDVDIPTPNEDTKKVSGDKAVMPTEGTELQEKLKTPQQYQHEKDFKSITDSGIKEIVVDKEKLQIVPHELTGEPVFETADEYQKYLKNK